jgi:peptide/nickel transport system permease protein
LDRPGGGEEVRLSLYIARRLVLLIPTIIGVTIITFALSHAAGPLYSAAMYCNPHLPISCPEQVEPIIKHYHLDDPIPVQYVYYMGALLQGDWGFTSTELFQGPVVDAVILFFPPTIELAVGATILATLLGIPTGTISAVKKDKVPDHVTRIVALAGYSVPYFVLAIFLQVLAVVFVPNWPIAGIYDPTKLDPSSSPWAFTILEGGPHLYPEPTHILVIDAALHGDWPIFWDAVVHLILPIFTLAFGVLGVILRMVRSGMVDAMNQDYVRTAWAKGLPKRVVIARHVRRNALLPAVTVIGLLFAGLLGGVVLVEDIFAWSGLGRWATAAILKSDSGGVMGSTLIFALALVFTNLVVDIIYARLDPRISL